MPGHGFTRRASKGEVLAQRVPLEVGGQVHVAQIGVTVEADAEHLVGLALVPVGAGVHGDPTLDRQGDSSGTSALIVTPKCLVMLVTRAKTWMRVSPPAVALADLGFDARAAAGWGRPRRGRRGWATSRWPRGNRSSRSRRGRAAPGRPARQASALTRTQRSSSGLTRLSSRSVPSASRSVHQPSRRRRRLAASSSKGVTQLGHRPRRSVRTIG